MIQITYFGTDWNEYTTRGFLCCWTIHGRQIGAPIEDPVGCGDNAEIRRKAGFNRLVDSFGEEEWFTAEIHLAYDSEGSDDD